MEPVHSVSSNNYCYTTRSHIFDELYNIAEMERERIYSGDTSVDNRYMRLLELISKTCASTHEVTHSFTRSVASERMIVNEEQYTLPIAVLTPKVTITRVADLRAGKVSIYECSICKRMFSSMCNLRKHVRLHSDSTYECHVCKVQFSSMETLRRHSKKQHENLLPGSSVDMNVVARTSTYKEQFKCELCGVPYQSKSGLYKHMSKHKDIKSFKCRLCGKFYADNRMLIEHEKFHITDRQHKCTICGKGFASNSYMKIHMRAHGTSKRYECGMCSSSFKYQGSLYTHMRLHNEKMSYSCVPSLTGLVDSRSDK